MRPIRSLAAVAVLGLTSIIAGVSTPAVAGAGELHPAAAPPAGTFSLRNYNSPHYCLGITGGEDDAAAIQWDCNGAPDQTWHRGNEDGTSGYYQIINGDGECLGVYQISTTEGATVVGWQCVAHPNQYWAWDESSESGYYYLSDYNSGQVVGVLGNSTAEGAQIVQWPNQHTPNNQLWQASPISASPVRSDAAWNGYILDAKSLGASYVDLATANWTVPKLACTKGEDGPSAVPWVGLGGLASDFSPLLQIGVWSQCLYKNGKEVQGDTPVWEEIQTTSDILNNITDAHPSLNYALTVNPGDSVTASVSFDQYAPKPYYLYLHDNTRGWTWAFSASSPLDTTYPRTAEWVVENPYAPGPPDLANFRIFKFTSMATELNGTVYGGVTDAAVVRVYSLPRVVNVSPVSTYTGELAYIG